MEDFPRAPFDGDSTDRSESSSKDRPRKGGSLRFTGFARVESGASKAPAETPQPAPRLENAESRAARFGAELIKDTKPGIAEKSAFNTDARIAETETVKYDHATETARFEDEQNDARPESAKNLDSETDEHSHENETLAPNELGGGEFIVALDRPVEEQIIPLHDAHVPFKATNLPEHSKEAEVTQPLMTEAAPVHTPAATFEDGLDRLMSYTGTPNELPTALYQTEQAPIAQTEYSQPELLTNTPESTFAPLPSAERIDSNLMPPTEVMMQTQAGELPYVSHMAPVTERFMHGGGIGVNEQVATTREFNKALDKARQEGRASGMWTGLLLGGGIEHIRHKRREKRQRRRNETVLKQLSDARNTYRNTAAEYVTKQSEMNTRLSDMEQQLTQQTAQSSRLEQQIQATPQERLAAQYEAQPQLHLQQSSYEQPLNYAPRSERFGMPTAAVATGAVAERFASAGGNQLKQNEYARNPQPNQPDQIMNAEGRIEIPEDHRLVMNGQYLAEVDRTTGEVVENSSFDYGQEYHQERAKEADATMQRTVAAGEVALVAAAIDKNDPNGQRQVHGGGGSGASSSPSGAMNAPFLGIQASQAAQLLPKQQSSDSVKKQSNTVQQPPLWPWLVALVAVVFVLIILL